MLFRSILTIYWSAFADGPQTFFSMILNRHFFFNVVFKFICDSPDEPFGIYIVTAKLTFLTMIHISPVNKTICSVFLQHQPGSPPFKCIETKICSRSFTWFCAYLRSSFEWFCIDCIQHWIGPSEDCRVPQFYLLHYELNNSYTSNIAINSILEMDCSE